MSRPTVYRTLNELVEAGLLRKMALGGRAVYEHDYGYPQHDHLHCTICDELIEFQITDLSKLCEAASAASTTSRSPATGSSSPASARGAPTSAGG